MRHGERHRLRRHVYADRVKDGTAACDPRMRAARPAAAPPHLTPTAFCGHSQRMVRHVAQLSSAPRKSGSATPIQPYEGSLTTATQLLHESGATTTQLPHQGSSATTQLLHARSSASANWPR